MIGSLAVWGLFLALALIAAVGAVVSILSEEPTEPGLVIGPVPVPAPERWAAPAVGFAIPRQGAAVNRSPPRVRPPVARPARSAPPDWLEREEDRETSLSMTTTEPYAPIRASTKRRPAATAETSPSEAIAEIDRLWWDLERLRRVGRRALPG